MSRTGTLRVNALTRRFRSSVSKTTSLSKRMGSSATRESERRETQTSPHSPSPCTHPTPRCPHAMPPPPDSSGATPWAWQHPSGTPSSLLLAKASRRGSETTFHLEGCLFPSLRWLGDDL